MGNQPLKALKKASSISICAKFDYSVFGEQKLPATEEPYKARPYNLFVEFVVSDSFVDKRRCGSGVKYS